MTSYLQPPPDAHLTCRGVKSDMSGDTACVPAPMLFFHGDDQQKTSYVTTNELTINGPSEGKPTVQAALDGARHAAVLPAASPSPPAAPPRASCAHFIFPLRGCRASRSPKCGGGAVSWLTQPRAVPDRAEPAGQAGHIRRAAEERPVSVLHHLQIGFRQG